MIYTQEDIHEFTCNNGIRWVHCPRGMLNVSVMDDGEHRYIRSTDMDRDMFRDGDSVCNGSSDAFRIDKYMGLDFVLVQKDYCTINEQAITLSGQDAVKVVMDKFGTLNCTGVTICGGYNVEYVWFEQDGSITFDNEITAESSKSVVVKTLSVQAHSKPQNVKQEQSVTKCNNGCEACYTICDKNRLICAIEDHFGVDLGNETESNKPVDLAINLLKNYKPKPKE